MKRNNKLVFMLSLLPCLAYAQTEVENVKNTVDYGHFISVQEEQSTAAISHVSAEDLKNKTSIDPSNNLYGLLSGLQVLQNGGASWNDGATMYIRGIGTMSAKEPLILVDGFERSIKNITVQEIESITVLKDAPSLALYGLKGANGVVYIKTKRGITSEKPEINLTYEFNMGTPNRLPELVDGYTYANALNEALVNDGLDIRYQNNELEAFKKGTLPGFYPNVDWVDETLKNMAFGDNVNFSIRGGKGIVKYFSQINYLDNRGIFKPVSENDGYSTQMKYSKLNIRTNLDVKLGKYTNVKLNMLGNFSESNAPSTAIDKIFEAIYRVPSGAFPIRTDKGLYGGTSIYNNNPVALIAGSGTERLQTRTIFADLTLTQDLGFITKGLNGVLRVSYDDSSTYCDKNKRDFAYQSAIYNWALQEGEYNKLREETELKFGSETQNFARHFNFGAELNYAKDWDKHHLSAVAMYEMDKMSHAGQHNTVSNISLGAQAHYVYDNRYIADLSLSGAANSILDPDDRWGFFPSVGLGWIISNESFCQNDWLDLLKLRASWGIVGGADYDYRLYTSAFGGGNPFYFKEKLSSFGGSKEKRLAMSGLTYEKSMKYNVGIDFSLFKKLNVTLDAFYDHRTDILVNGNGVVSKVLGITAPKINRGIVNNKGFEASLNWSDQINDFKYSVGGQFSFVRNTIDDMGEEYRPYEYLKRTGNSLEQIFGYEVEGIYKDQADIDNREVKQLLSTVHPGDLKFKDQNNDKIIDKYDMVKLGYNDVCPEIYYSFNLGGEYKGVGIYALFQGAGNYSRILNTPGVYRPLIHNNTISEEYYNNRWSQQNPNGKYPRLTTVGSENNYNNNSLWIADASFLKLRTLEVYYNLPETLLEKTKFIKSARLFARGHDLFCADGIDVADPESIQCTHPTMKQYTFGFNLSF